MNTVPFITIAFIFLCDSLVLCQYDHQLRITPYGPFSNQHFGSSVDIHQNTYVIGAAMEYMEGQGAVYVYGQYGTTLHLESVLSPDTAHSIDQFGASVAIEDSFLVVGAPYSSNEQNLDGMVFVYLHTGEEWVQHSMLYPGYPIPGGKFGLAMAIALPYLIVGDAEGTVVIYKLDNGYWAEDTVLYGPGFVDVDIDGEYAVLGASGDNALGYGSGAAYVYRREGASWVEEIRLVASDGEAHDAFGSSVAIDGEYILIGAGYADGQYSSSGAAYVYQRHDDQWLQKAKLSADDGGFNDCFGCSMAMDGQRALVGAGKADATAIASGAAYYYQFDGSQWVQSQKFAPLNLGRSAKFGRAVAIYADKCLIGASEADEAYLFTNTPVTLAGENDPPKVPGSFFLTQNHPNPFNPSTTISYDLPEAAMVRLVVHDLQGREITRLADSYLPAGSYESIWDGRSADGRLLPSGIYIARLETAGYSKSIKMVLLK
ncbi:FlgD immunoglobulin-like domain containing protein [Candidatus Neomarinimicrobiota bacterium]